MGYWGTMIEGEKLVEEISVLAEVMMALIRVVAMEEVKHVTFWVYFEGRANGISCQIGMEYVGEERRQGDSKVFILSNWKDGLAIPELGKL